MSHFQFHSEPLQDAWLDIYGHLNEAYYLVPFTNATFRMQDHFGLGDDYFRETGCAMYTVETHLRYLSDVRPPAELAVETQILGLDAKRLWFAHLLVVDGSLRATGEFMVLHYDTRAERTSVMPDTTIAMLEEAVVAEQPDWVGRQISLKKR